MQVGEITINLTDAITAGSAALMQQELSLYKPQCLGDEPVGVLHYALVAVPQ